jgi:hypothetical protein
MLTIEGNEIRFEGVTIGYILADRATHMRLRDYIQEMLEPPDCDLCNEAATVYRCADHNGDT